MSLCICNENVRKSNKLSEDWRLSKLCMEFQPQPHRKQFVSNIKIKLLSFFGETWGFIV
jgi:hypothetical protein